MPVSRRQFVHQIGWVAGAIGVAQWLRSPLQALEPYQGDLTPDAVLARLMEGNKRFTSGQTKLSPRTPADFARDVEGQAPPAIILSCADSRVPPEFIFDQPIGGLFVLRVAGNIVGSGPILKGSVEFAVAELGAKLIIVMGHSQCGAVDAAIQHIDASDALPGSIGAMVDYIRPVVRRVAAEPEQPGDKLVAVTKANAVANAKRLAALEPIVSDFVQRKAVKVVGAYYELSTGAVEILG
jgi:carbonic anhydrase